MNMPQKILIIESDVRTARALHDGLKMSFPNVRVVFDIVAAAKEFHTFQPDFLIAGCDTLYQSGPAAFCREIRKLYAFPIILYGSKIRSIEKVRSLEAGADDFLERPVDPRELAARVQAIWRRYLASPPAADSRMSAPKFVQYPQLFISLTNYTVIYNDHKVEMPPRELELLYFLAKSPNRVFTREQLLDQVWGYDYVGDARTVDVHIKRIRSKIKDHATWSLDTVWGVGYKFSSVPTHNASDAPQAPSDQSDFA